MNKNVKAFLGHVSAECIKHKVSISLEYTKDIVDESDGTQSGGSFDNTVNCLNLEVGTKNKKWLDILVHEYCHFLQWKRNTKIWKEGSRKINKHGDSYSNFFRWVDGKPFPVRLKIAIAHMGQVELELLEPISEGPHKDFLDTHGEGLQHLCFYIDNYDEWMVYLKQQGIKLLYNAEGHIKDRGYLRAAYLDTADGKPGNTLIEISEIKSNG